MATQSHTTYNGDGLCKLLQRAIQSSKRWLGSAGAAYTKLAPQALLGHEAALLIISTAAV